MVATMWWLMVLRLGGGDGAGADGEIFQFVVAEERHLVARRVPPAVSGGDAADPLDVLVAHALAAEYWPGGEIWSASICSVRWRSSSGRRGWVSRRPPGAQQAISASRRKTLKRVSTQFDAVENGLQLSRLV